MIVLILKFDLELQFTKKLVWLPPPSSFLILGLGPAYGRVMVAFNILMFTLVTLGMSIRPTSLLLPSQLHHMRHALEYLFPFEFFL
ncbi:hypothetical protein BpHYR1_018179 [Brachionus plicatilis]|uniref:Uncharacterized protein n=1 Tax=Brachionus plicatilis TaxID=10195 RepID=A0A3M7R4M2_BRAPC|nr:hypothetical protein BpHYR1_018179 [Brachionus plicatilis]